MNVPFRCAGLRRARAAALSFLVVAAIAAALTFHREPRLESPEIRILKGQIERLEQVNRSLRVRLHDAAEELARRSAPNTDPVQVGRKLPPLQAAGWINGDAPKKSSLAGKVIVLDLWAFW